MHRSRPGELSKEAAAAMGEIAAESFLALAADRPDPELRNNSNQALQQITAGKANARS
jgi:ABC-type antimicrobial peptide transport system permease subunit